jgi:hypothetical protein
MAPPKKSAAARGKASAPAAPRAPRAAPAAAAPVANGNPNRLLREAAWSRMFGRTEKNPFTR